MDGPRQTGRTTRQMQAAKIGAAFICVGAGDKDYAKRLAHTLGRADLKVFTPEALYPGDSFRGVTFPEIVVDHAARLTGVQFAALGEFRRYSALRALGDG